MLFWAKIIAQSSTSGAPFGGGGGGGGGNSGLLHLGPRAQVREPSHSPVSQPSHECHSHLPAANEQHASELSASARCTH